MQRTGQWFASEDAYAVRKSIPCATEGCHVGMFYPLLMCSLKQKILKRKCLLQCSALPWPDSCLPGNGRRMVT